VEVGSSLGSRLGFLATRIADWLGDLIEEAAFRVALASKVLLGRVPLRTERRSWSRVVEGPVLIDLYDWTSERRIFSVLVWPPLEVELPEAYDAHAERVEEVIQVISRGAAEKRWSTHWRVDDGLRWDSGRQVWVASDGFAYSVMEAGDLPLCERMDNVNG
jgi:hypothetical protein